MEEDKKGCLIDIKKLSPGDILFDIFNGEVTVYEIDNNDDDYPIKCIKIRDDNRESEQFYYTRLGKDCKHEVYPKVYTQDPFKYAFNIAREKSNENKMLCQKLTILEMTLSKLGHTKDV
jgi:hypothetical protein